MFNMYITHICKGLEAHAWLGAELKGYLCCDLQLKLPSRYTQP